MNSSQTTTVPSAIPAFKTSGREKISPRIAAKRSQLSIWAIYRLLKAGYVEYERPLPHTTLIFADSLESHLAATRDPEFWEAR